MRLNPVKLLVFSLISILMFSSLIFAGGPSFSLKANSMFASSNPATMTLVKFANEVKEKTKGDVVITVFDNAQLGSESDQLQSLQMGSLDFGIAGTAIQAIEPKFKILDMPFLFNVNARKKVYALLDGKLGDELVANFPNKGVRLVAWYENGFRHITNNKRPINSLEDLKGLKMRVPGQPTSIAIMNALGTNASPCPLGELYTALSTGVFDAQENPLSNIYTSRYYEVQKYLTITGHMYGPLELIVSEATWKKLPASYQKIILRAGKDTSKYDRELITKSDGELIAQLKEKGMVVTYPDLKPFKKATQPVIDKFISESPANQDLYNRFNAFLKNN